MTRCYRFVTLCWKCGHFVVSNQNAINGFFIELRIQWTWEVISIKPSDRLTSFMLGSEKMSIDMPGWSHEVESLVSRIYRSANFISRALRMPIHLFWIFSLFQSTLITSNYISLKATTISFDVSPRTRLSCCWKKNHF